MMTSVSVRFHLAATILALAVTSCRSQTKETKQAIKEEFERYLLRELSLSFVELLSSKEPGPNDLCSKTKAVARNGFGKDFHVTTNCYPQYIECFNEESYFGYRHHHSAEIQVKVCESITAAQSELTKQAKIIKMAECSAFLRKQLNYVACRLCSYNRPTDELVPREKCYFKTPAQMTEIMFPLDVMNKDN